ncbi:MAG: YcaO-like family protein, partial [Alphaproteobacteria bacterium]|nr:YcaO-like family protein [Alphaproteobacteria bacterium]
HQFCFGDSNGCASGGNLEEAILQGTLELIERDAISQWWYNRLALPAADLSGVDTKIVDSMERYCNEHGLTFEVLDLTADLGIPVAACVTARASDGGAITIGFGAHLDPVVASTRALTEVSQLLPFNDQGEFALDGDKFTAAKDWYDTAFLEQHPYLKAADADRADLAPGLGDVASIDQAVRFCVDRLAEFDLELIVHDFDRKDVPLSAVRTAVPGICHFWNRRGNPRLYEAPVRAGRLDKPLTEDELNPISFYV